MTNISMIQSRFTSLLNPEKIASYDHETDETATITLIHSAARFLYIREGQGTIEIDGKEYHLLPHTVVSILPWSVTTIKNVQEPLFYERIIYNLNFINLFLRSDFNPNHRFLDLWQDMRQCPVLLLSEKERHHFEYCIERIREEEGTEGMLQTPKQKRFGDMYTIATLIQMLVLFNRGIEGKGQSSSEQDHLETKNGFQINELLNYLYSHMQEKITLERLEKIFFVSQSTIVKKLKSSLGYSYQELIMSMRVSKAMDLLTYTVLNLTEIAALVGFNDAAHLIKSFEAMEGMTPAAFRKNVQGKSKNAHLQTTDAEKGMTIINEILNEYQNPNLHPATIAEKFNISLAELNRITIFYVERSAAEFIAWLRISRASEMLLRTRMSISEVAYVVGFNTTKTFYRYFMKYFSTTPTQFREQVHFQREDGTTIEPDEAQSDNQ
ncbi:MAG: helix-turn-helix domain-containing protein [Peptoniphilaceae bacterium]|nr:helix-turn-helix domain-containing protein [Peptoniphilaceae bacterium]